MSRVHNNDDDSSDHQIKQVELSPISIPEHKLPPFRLSIPQKFNNIFIPLGLPVPPCRHHRLGLA